MTALQILPVNRDDLLFLYMNYGMTKSDNILIRLALVTPNRISILLRKGLSLIYYK